MHAFVNCRLDICHYYTLANLIQKLQRVQNCAGCMTYHERENIWPRYPEYYENYTGFWLTNALCLKFCFSPKTALHYVAPRYIQDLLIIYSPTRNLRSYSSNLLAGTFSKDIGCVPLGVSRSGSVMRDHSHHGRSNEPMNPCPEWIYWFIWSTMIRVISAHWSWSGSSQRNAPRLPCVLSLCSKIKNWNSLPLELKIPIRSIS